MNNLEVIKLSKKYEHKYALKNFTFTLAEGEIVGLLGKRNAGKTTLLNCLAGNIQPDSGELIFNGINVLRNPLKRKAIAILINSSFIESLSYFENFQTAPKNKLIGRLAFNIKQKPKGSKVLLDDSKILMLDEPFSQLDSNDCRIVREKIKKIVVATNVGVLISEHTMDDVKDICGRIICIENGQKIYDGIMSDEIIYYITIDRAAPELMDLLAKIGSTVDQTNNLIQVIGNDRLSETLKLAVEYSKVLKIEITQDSLAKFLTI